MFKIRKIRNKLGLAFGLVLLFSFLVSSWTIFSIFKIIEYQDVVGQINQVNVYRLELRRAEKNFMLRDCTKPSLFEKGESNYLTLFHKNEVIMSNLMDSLSGNKFFGSLLLEKEFDETKLRLKEYTDAFYAVVEKVRKRGFKDWGDEGELRKAIHAVEKDNVADRELILDLRKNEKDFFLRKDLQYVDKFDEGIENLKTALANSKAENIEDAIRNIATYRDKFHQIVEAEKAIGLNEKQGLLAQLQDACDKLDPAATSLGQAAALKTKDAVNRSIWIIVMAMLAQLCLSVLLAIGFSREFTRNATRIRDNIVQLSKGEYPEETAITSVDEFGESQGALNNLIERVKTAAGFAGKIGNGELTAQYDQRYSDDVLAKALMAMHEKLKLSTEEDNKRNWATQGLADFGELLRKQDQDVEKFADHVLSFIVKYSNSNQGRLYIVEENGDEKYLKMISAYAWNKKKFLEQKINVGEGLAGQCWQEGEPIYMTEVPEDYVAITSGLGYTTPRNIFILPLKINEEIYGVIELASLKRYEEHERELIKKLTVSLASAISTVTINQRTKTLLAQTQQQAEEMRAQEEEMRQNMEELSATQEEMSRKEQEYLKRIEELEMKNRD